MAAFTSFPPVLAIAKIGEEGQGVLPPHSFVAVSTPETRPILVPEKVPILGVSQEVMQRHMSTQLIGGNYVENNKDLA